MVSLMTNIQAEEATNNNVTKLYVATFDRAPDKSGLDHWVQCGLSLEDIAKSFFEQDETKEKYPEEYSTVDFVNEIYINLFNRSPDQEGLEYWVDVLTRGIVSYSVFILAVTNGAHGEDATILDNKTEVGLKFVEYGLEDASVAKSVMQNVTSSQQTMIDSFNKIHNIYITGNNNSIEIEGDTTNINNSTTTNNYYTVNNYNTINSGAPSPSPSQQPSTQTSKKPVISNFDLSEYGEGLGKVEVDFSVSSSDKLTKVRITCGVGSTYGYVESKDSSLYTGSRTIFLENENWSDLQVHCKTDIRTNDATADEQSDYVYMSVIRAPMGYPTVPDYSPPVVVMDTYSDPDTGLMWQDDYAAQSVGKPWVTQSNYNAGNYYNTSGDTASTYCSNLLLGGYYNWRLPNKNELESIVDSNKYNPAIVNGFQNTSFGYYWSSTSDMGGNGYAWVVHSSGGGVGATYRDKGSNFFVRCVRAGE